VDIKSKVDEKVSERAHRYKPSRRSRQSSEYDYVSVVEEISDEGNMRGRPGNPTRRSSIDGFDSDNAAPSHVQSYVRLKPTSTHINTQEPEHIRTRIRREQAPSSLPAFRYVSAPERSSWRSSSSRSDNPQHVPSDEWQNKWDIPRRKSAEDILLETSYNTTQKIPIKFVDEDDNRPETFPGKYYEPDQESSADRLFDGDGGYNEEWGGTSPWGTPQSKSHEQTIPRYASRRTNFENTKEGSSRSDGSRERRRRERISPSEAITPWGSPHVLRPKNDDQVIVVTERYVYRPKKQIGEDRLQEYTDRAILGERDQRGRFAATDDAAKYYQDDWSREHSPSRETYRNPSQRKGYRRDSFVDASLADSDLTYGDGKLRQSHVEQSLGWLVLIK
jgi:hypothetical protein